MNSSNHINSEVPINGVAMDYVAFGAGRPLIILPGLSDGITTVKGKAFMLSRYYSDFSKHFRVYIFSRKRELEKDCTTKDMARDQKLAMDVLGLEKAYVMGVSQGGMIAQHLAADFPQKVEKLVLAVTAPRQNPTIQAAVKGWIKMAEDGDYAALIMDTMEKTYSPKKLKSMRLMAPVIKRAGRPKSFGRFLIQAHACLTHDAYDDLDKIKCRALILGGDSDLVVGSGASEEIADKIENSRLVIYEGLGHGAYEEAKDFNQIVLEFLLS